MFDAVANFEMLRGAATELHCSLRVSVERLDHALQFGWANDLWENFKEAISADQIKRLSEMNECCSLHFFCSCRRERTMSIVDIQLGSHIVTPGRYVPPASGGVSVCRDNAE